MRNFDKVATIPDRATASYHFHVNCPMLLSSENVRLTGLRKCPFRRVLPFQVVVSLLRS